MFFREKHACNIVTCNTFAMSGVRGWLTDVLVDEGELLVGEHSLRVAVAGGAEGGEESLVAVDPAVEAVEGGILGQIGRKLPGNFGFGKGSHEKRKRDKGKVKNKSYLVGLGPCWGVLLYHR